MSSADVMSDYLNWTTTSYPTALLFPVLPHPLLTLASAFRILAFLTLVPVFILTLTDLIGWVAFKLVWRPLGYTSTIRFKDPEPSTRLVSSPPFAASDSPRKRSRSRPRKVPDELPDDLEPISVPDSASSSSTSSPTISYTVELSPSPPRSPSTSPNGAPSHLAPRRPRSDSESSSGSSVSSIRRARAPSIGVEGPLFGSGEDLVTLNEEGSDDEDEHFGPRAETSESESESNGGNGRPLTMLGTAQKVKKRGRSQHTGLPRGGAGFGFTKMPEAVSTATDY